MSKFIFCTLGPPKWIHEPSDKIVHIGHQLVLKCEASGYPTPKLSWFKVKGKLLYINNFI